MADKFERDLSHGSVVKQLITFSLPFLVSNMIQSLYNVADMVIVGQFSGTASISGVNIGGQVTFLLTQLILGLCTGATVLIAQYLGSQAREAIKKTIGTLFTVLTLSAAAITTVMLFLVDPVLNLLQTPAESFGEARDYLFITVIGIFFIFGYNALAAIMRGLGDSKRPLYFVAIACVTNVVLDLVLVGGGMGAKGAAIATVISQALSMILCVIYLIRSNFIFDFKLKSFAISRKHLKLLMQLGIPSSIQSVIVSVSFMFLTVMVNTTGGYIASAAVGVVGKLNSFAIMPAIALSSSISAMAAQNIGAGKWDRAKKTFKTGLIIAYGISVVIFAVVQLFPEFLLQLFDHDPLMIAAGVEYIRTFSFDYILVPACFCFNGLFIGAGHTTFSMINNILSSVALRIPASFIFGVSLGWGLTGIGLGAPAASLGALLLAWWYYLSGKWNVNKAL